jgi:hypothetical protein
MTDRAAETLQAFRGHAATLAREIVDLAASRAVAGAERAKSASAAVASGAGERVRGLPHKASEEVVPPIREVALNAASLALDLWQAAREKAGEVIDVAESGREGAVHAIEDAERAASDATHAVTAQIALTGRKAKEASAHAAEATIATGKDTAAAVVWGGAAAAIVFYLMLDEKRRKQVLDFAETLVKTSIELVRDFRGYDEEFA